MAGSGQVHRDDGNEVVIVRNRHKGFGTSSPYSGWIPAALTSLAVSSISLCIIAANCSGVLATTAKPRRLTAGALAAPISLVPVSQVLFGTDFAFRPGAEEIEGLTALCFESRDLRAIERDNALRLMPGLKG